MDWSYLRANWRSTLQSTLTITFALTGYLMTVGTISPKVAASLVAINGVAKILVGLVQQDAETTAQKVIVVPEKT